MDAGRRPAPRCRAPRLTSGVEPQYIEPSVRAADDFFMHANAKWIAATVIPADKPSWSPSYILHEEAQERLRLIIEEAAASKGRRAEHRSAQGRRLLSQLHGRGADRVAEDEAARPGVRGHRPHQGQVRDPRRARPPEEDRHPHAGRPRHRSGQAQFDRLRRLPVPGRSGPSRPRVLPRQRRREDRRHPQEVRRARRIDDGEDGQQDGKTGCRRYRGVRDRAGEDQLDQGREPRSGQDVPQDRRSRTCPPMRPGSTGMPIWPRRAYRPRSATSCCTRTPISRTSRN